MIVDILAALFSGYIVVSVFVFCWLAGESALKKDKRHSLLGLLFGCLFFASLWPLWAIMLVIIAFFRSVDTEGY